MRFVFLFFLIGSTILVFGQSQDTISYPYKITGIIRDEKGNVIPGVNVISPGDANMQVSDSLGKYHAYIYGPKTSVVFSYRKFKSVLYFPDGRTNVDIVLIRQKGSKGKH